MNERLDEHELQRLLDGSLAADERIMLLRYAEEHPSNWRRIAMAFVEEQVLRNELAALQPNFVQASVNQAVALPDPEAKLKTNPRRIGWLTQAAVMCLALGGAVWMGRESVQPQDTAVQISDVTPLDAPTAPGDYTIVLTPASSPEPVGLREVADTHNVSQQDSVEQMLTPLFDQESLAIFREHGYTVEEEPVFYIVPGQAGEKYVIPRRNVSLVAHRE